MKKRIINYLRLFLIFVGLFFSLKSPFFVKYQDFNYILFSSTFFKIEKNAVDNEILAILEIDKIHLKKELFALDSTLNTVSENIEVIKGSTMPDVKYSNLILAAHSGNSSIAYFSNLNQLEIGDTAGVYYKNNKYIYILVNTYSEQKDGTITIHRGSKKSNLTLITCNKQNKELQDVYIFELIKIE